MSLNIFFVLEIKSSLSVISNNHFYYNQTKNDYYNLTYYNIGGCLSFI